LSMRCDSKDGGAPAGRDEAPSPGRSLLVNFDANQNELRELTPSPTSGTKT
jgi:hypothetical protein